MTDALEIQLGNVKWGPGSAPAFTTFALNANNDQWEMIFQADEAATITRLGFRFTSYTGTSPTFKISLQGVDGSGNPDGTIKGGGSPASKEFNPQSLSWSTFGWKWLTLDNSYVCTRGELLSIVISYVSGTIDGSNLATFTTTTSSSSRRFPYAIHNDGGSRSRQTTGAPVFGYGSASKAYGAPIQTVNTHTYNSTTGSADEYAMKFVLPSGWGSTYNICGAILPLALTASGTSKLILYDGGNANSTSILQTFTFDHDYVATVSAGPVIIRFSEETLSTLSFGNTYRISIQPQGAVNVAWASYDVAAVEDWDAHPMGQQFSMSTRLDAGDWSDTTTRRLHGDIILSDWTEPVGGGGLASKIFGSQVISSSKNK